MYNTSAERRRISLLYIILARARREYRDSQSSNGRDMQMQTLIPRRMLISLTTHTCAPPVPRVCEFAEVLRRHDDDDARERSYTSAEGYTQKVFSSDQSFSRRMILKMEFAISINEKSYNTIL